MKDTNTNINSGTTPVANGGQQEPEVDGVRVPQPFASVCHLVDDYGLSAVLYSIAERVEFLSDDEDLCFHCTERFVLISEILFALTKYAEPHCPNDASGDVSEDFVKPVGPIQ